MTRQLNGKARAQAQRSIGARAEAVYAVLADYTAHHPRIMPPSYFSNLEVEEGGVGSGTMFHITLRIGGQRQRLHMRVDEPEPGRVLTETNLDTGVVTEFSVGASSGEAQALTRISSTWEPKAGLGGLVDRTLSPLLMRWLFGKQLRELDHYMRSQSAPQ